jgi:hypothetical protein
MQSVSVIENCLSGIDSILMLVEEIDANSNDEILLAYLKSL